MNKKTFITIVFFSLYYLSCKNEPHTKRIGYGEYSIEGDIKIAGKDTIFNGPISYYDKAGSLMAIVNFKDNKINGKAVDYYRNGKLKQEEEYENGVKNGITRVYDSTGKIISEINYFSGLMAGSQTTFHSDSAYVYKFVNLEDWPLYSCTYENNQAVERGNLLNYFTHYIESNGEKKIQLFIYLLNPPHKEITYKLYYKDLKSNDSIVVQSLSYHDGFFQILQLDIPKADHKYFFGVEAFYPKENVKVKDILKDYQKELKLPIIQPEDTVIDSGGVPR